MRMFYTLAINHGMQSEEQVNLFLFPSVPFPSVKMRFFAFESKFALKSAANQRCIVTPAEKCEMIDLATKMCTKIELAEEVF